MRHLLFVVIATTLGCLVTGGLLAFATARSAPAEPRAEVDSPTAMAWLLTSARARATAPKEALPDPFSDAELERWVSRQIDAQLDRSSGSVLSLR